MKAIFALTSHTNHGFIEHGFEKIDLASLPEERRTRYNYQCNSKLLQKPVS